MLTSLTITLHVILRLRLLFVVVGVQCAKVVVVTSHAHMQFLVLECFYCWLNIDFGASLIDVPFWILIGVIFCYINLIYSIYCKNWDFFKIRTLHSNKRNQLLFQL